MIVALSPKRHRRHHAPTIEALVRQLEGSPSERLVDLLLAGPLGIPDAVNRLGLDSASGAGAIEAAVGEDVVIQLGDRLLARAWLDSAVGRIAAATGEFLAGNPLRPAAPREHVRGAVRFDAVTFDTAVHHGIAAGRIEERAGGGLAIPGHQVSLSPAQQAEVDRFLAGLRSGGFSPPTDQVPAAPLVAHLAAAGLVEDTGAGIVFDAEVFEEMVSRVSSHIAEHGSVSLAEVRDLFGTSRKYAQALLEHLDDRRITRRVGDTRVLREPLEVVR